jgi:asparagine synthetase B (glutamine-hydrolysing)
MKLDPTFTEEVKKLKTNNILTDKPEIIKHLSTLLTNAVETRKANKIAIGFSGGIDSTLIAFLAEKLNLPFTLYSVGLENSPDLEYAKKVAKHYNWDLISKTLTPEEVENIFKKLIKLLPRVDVVNLGVGAVTYAVCEQVKEKVIFTGLGSEEIFAGYERHKGNITENCWKGLEDIYERDIQRDSTIANHFKLIPKCPFLDKELIEYSMQIDENLKMNEYKKLILRHTAEHLGLFKDFCWRKKKAAQYGSYFDKVLTKLAKKEKLTKREYILTISK